MSYTIRVSSDNQEFPVDKRVQDGQECGGYLLVCFDDNGHPIMETLNGVSTMSIARYLAADVGDVSNIIKQADAIAEGLINAKMINEKRSKEKRGIESLIKDMIDNIDN